MFFERGKSKLSMDRVDEAESEGRMKDLTVLAETRIEEQGKVFYGWATLQVCEAEQDRRRFTASPTVDNRWHSDIILPKEDVDGDALQKLQAQELAMASKWLPVDDQV